jgi:DNA invertase Pin-like site-specific DNA recombinase
MRVGLYARVSTQDQQTLALQREAMEAYVQQRAWETDLPLPFSQIPLKMQGLVYFTYYSVVM